MEIAVVGNIIVATLLAFSVIIIGIFDIVPNTFDFNQKQMMLAFAILFDYAKRHLLCKFDCCKSSDLK